MLGCFPTVYPDELFYSACARFSDRMQYTSRYAPLQDLLGTVKVKAIADLPSHLETFLNRLPPGHHYTIDTLIDNHTLFPFYRPFLKRDWQQRVRECMQNNDGHVIHALLGSTHNKLYSLGYLRFCPQCVEADRKLFGECYWHRVHQLSCVRICPTHSIPLLESGVHTSNRRYGREFISAEKAVQEKYTPISIVEAFSQNFRRIARDVSWLLDHPQFSYDSDLLKTQYYSILVNQGFARHGKRLYPEELIRSFNDYYTQDFLQLIHCRIKVDDRDSWLRRAIRPGGSGTHPLHHLLLIHFLAYEAETFFNLPRTQRPFGDGPWPCLNPASDHYKQYRVLDCQWEQRAASNQGRPTGTFSCECGFVYSRKGPDKTSNDHFQLDHVKAYGLVWETVLQHLWYDPSITLKEIAWRLQVDPITATHQALRIGLSSPRPGCKKQWQLSDRPNLNDTLQRRHSQEECRQAWLLLMEEHPGVGRYELIKKLPNIYSWLERNDLEWLKVHRPLSQRKVPPPRQIDWERRDKEVAEAVKASAHRLKNTNGFLIKLTLTALGKDTGYQKAFARYLDKLPLTKHVLSQVVETREDYAIRRILWFARCYQEEHICPTRNQLVERAYVKKVIAALPRVKEAIENALVTLNSSNDISHEHVT
ncbi:MAG: TnsD family Tn7-like transposition protein [Ktedonobacteraceae bacterium]